MAKRVKYYQNNEPEMYAEGPFVMTDANGWRIEVGCDLTNCPIIPDSSIYDLLHQNSMRVDKSSDPEVIAKSVDWLNDQVRGGKVVCVDHRWVPRALSGSKAVATVTIHPDTKRLIIDLELGGRHYGDYPIDQDNALGQLQMLFTDCQDYEVSTIELRSKL